MWRICKMSWVYTSKAEVGCGECPPSMIGTLRAEQNNHHGFCNILYNSDTIINIMNIVFIIFVCINGVNYVLLYISGKKWKFMLLF